MRSHEERIAEVRRRITEKERQKRLRSSSGSPLVSCVAACLAVIFGCFPLSCPGIVRANRCWELPPDLKRRQRCSAAGAAPGYIVIGLLAFRSRRMRDDLVFPCPSAGQRGTDGEQRGDHARWKLISNLLQFLVTLLGFCLSGIRYLRQPDTVSIFC